MSAESILSMQSGVKGRRGKEVMQVGDHGSVTGCFWSVNLVHGFNAPRFLTLDI